MSQVQNKISFLVTVLIIGVFLFLTFWSISLLLWCCIYIYSTFLVFFNIYLFSFCLIIFFFLYCYVFCVHLIPNFLCFTFFLLCKFQINFIFICKNPIEHYLINFKKTNTANYVYYINRCIEYENKYGQEKKSIFNVCWRKVGVWERKSNNCISSPFLYFFLKCIYVFSKSHINRSIYIYLEVYLNDA